MLSLPRSCRSILYGKSRRRYYSQDLLNDKYNRAKSFIKSKKLPPSVNRHGVFANDVLSLSDIEAYGFDYDYTLTNYKKSVEFYIYDCAKRDLIKRSKYPKEIDNFEYDENFCVRGLHYDIEKGLLLKVDSFHQIQLGTVYKGRRMLKDEEVLKLYRRRHIPLQMIEGSYHGVPSASNMVQMVDIFAKPLMCLLADIIEWFDGNNIEYEPYSIHHDVLRSVQSSHPMFHDACCKNPEVYLEKFPELSSFLENLLAHRKKIFLITNSHFDTVNIGMSYMIGKDWRDLFDLVIINARKPTFFKDSSAFFRRFDPDEKILSFDKVSKLSSNKIYSGGNLTKFEEIMDWESEQVLYFGDHPYTDLSDLTLFHGWRTAAIIKELEEEIDTINDEEFKKNVNWSNALQKLIEKNQDHDSEEEQFILKAWMEELHSIRYKLKNMSNPYFGSIFRTHINPTSFSRKLFRFADIYTSSITNMSQYSINHTFYPRRGALPHEFKHWTG